MPSVADAVCQTLKAYGTVYFFCLTGGDHALWIALDDAGIEVVLCRSEHAAVNAADGYARASGKPGDVAHLRSALQDALTCGRPALVDVLVDKEVWAPVTNFEAGWAGARRVDRPG